MSGTVACFGEGSDAVRAVFMFSIHIASIGPGAEDKVILGQKSPRTVEYSPLLDW